MAHFIDVKYKQNLYVIINNHLIKFRNILIRVVLYVLTISGIQIMNAEITGVYLLFNKP